MNPVRRALEFLFTRVLRSRLGVALVIAVLVFGVIGAARLVSGPVDSTLGLSTRPSQPISTVDPHAGDDGVLSSPPAAVAPKTRPGEATPEQTAGRFTTAWLTGPGSTAEAWQSRLRPLSTPALLEKMTGADPETVPARRVTGAVTLRARTESFVEALVPLDDGRLRLELVAPDGRWLVDAVDWERQ
ncbi:hypothetical protein ACFFMM_14420 [Micromonospora chaiyaphumensis]|uniref:Uncharacterized protein n=1 Tax=Micromonospora chaiyaphumensis TaxID=307119 RepID=A0A1C4YES1_9ACTN|nr:hypothetical protein [Micromonospora chaiyaphumensis]SCF19233.1 hypothetical protein GA0070214_108121 [Micromonospora chaiyaphumensis]